MKSLIDALGKSEILTAVAQLQAEMGMPPPETQAEHLNILTAMPLGLFIKDPESRIVLMNPACEALWGVRFADMRGNCGERLMPAEQLEGFRAYDRAAFASGKRSVNEELVWHHARGENRWMETHKQPLFDPHGRPRLLIGMCVDISDRKRAEQALEASVQQLRALSDHQHTTKERERRRIALGIHDDLAQNLLALRLDLSMLHARTGLRQPLLHQRAAQALTTLDASIHVVRDLINKLHPPTLELGLSPAVEWLLRQLERNGMRCVLQLIDDNATLDQRKTSAMFHIIEAGLGYLGGHAGAHELRVALSLRPERLSITISGDGQPATDSGAGALDLSAMRERLAAFNGELAVAPLPGAGTVLHMTVPGHG